PRRVRSAGSWILAILLVAFATGSCSASAEAYLSAMNGAAIETLPQPELREQLAAMAARGVQVVRSDAPWATIEPQPPGPTGPVWQFAQTDAWVRSLADNGLTWEPILDYSVWWAKSCTGF